VILCASVILVSTTVVVNPLASIVVSVVPANIVPLGDQTLFVSNLNLRSTDGDTNFFNHNFIVVIATHVPMIGNSYLVLAVTSPILATDIACANVGHDSTNRLSLVAQFSPNRKVSLSTRVSTDHIESVTVFNSAGHTKSSEPVLPVLVQAVTSVDVAFCTLPDTVVDALGVPVLPTAVHAPHSLCSRVPVVVL
jgi:hypothetical protein